MSRPADTPQTLSAEIRAELADLLELFVTVADAAEILGVTRSRVVQLADAHERGRSGLPSVRTPGRHRLFLRTDVEYRRETARRALTDYPLTEHDALMLTRYMPREDTP